MVLHLKWMVHWISIVVIHMFMPKDSNDSTTYLWHCHVSHIGIKRMKKLHVDGSLDSLVFWKVWDMRTMSIGIYAWRNSMQMDRLDSLDFESLETCKSYHMGKMTESLVFSEMEQESNLLEVIHFDVCSPMSAEACSGYRYVLTSQIIWVDSKCIYLMKYESELLKGWSNFRVKLKIVVTRG